MIFLVLFICLGGNSFLFSSCRILNALRASPSLMVLMPASHNTQIAACNVSGKSKVRGEREGTGVGVRATPLRRASAHLPSRSSRRGAELTSRRDAHRSICQTRVPCSEPRSRHHAAPYPAALVRRIAKLSSELARPSVALSPAAAR